MDGEPGHVVMLSNHVLPHRNVVDFQGGVNFE